MALVEDKPGVLTRMASLFRRRGFNIESIAVGHSELPNLSRMTIVVNGTANILEQVRKQLGKVVNVVKVTDVLTYVGYGQASLVYQDHLLDVFVLAYDVCEDFIERFWIAHGYNPIHNSST